jgi:hypothetical protein
MEESVKTTGDEPTDIRDALLQYPFRIISFIAYVFYKPEEHGQKLKNVYSWRDLTTDTAHELVHFDDAYTKKLSSLYFGDEKYKDYFHGTIEHVAYRDQCLAFHYNFQHPASIYVERPWRHFNVCLVRQTLQRIIVSNGDYCETLRETFVSNRVFTKYYLPWFVTRVQYTFLQTLLQKVEDNCVSYVSTILDCVRYFGCLKNMGVTTEEPDDIITKNIRKNISAIYASLSQLSADFDVILILSRLQLIVLSCSSLQTIENHKNLSVNRYLQSLVGCSTDNVYQGKTVEEVVDINQKDIEQMEDERVQRVNDFEFWLDITYWLNIYRFINPQTPTKHTGGRGFVKSRRIRRSVRKHTRVRQTKPKARRFRSRRRQSSQRQVRVRNNSDKQTVKALHNKQKGGEELEVIEFDALHNKGLVVLYVHRSFTTFRIVIAKDRVGQLWYIEMRHKQESTNNPYGDMLKVDLYQTGAGRRGLVKHTGRRGLVKHAGSCGFMKYTCTVGNMFQFKAKQIDTTDYEYVKYVTRAMLCFQEEPPSPPTQEYYANFMLTYWNGYHPVWYEAFKTGQDFAKLSNTCQVTTNHDVIVLPGMDKWLCTKREMHSFIKNATDTSGGNALSSAKLLAWKIPRDFQQYFCRIPNGNIIPILWMFYYTSTDKNEWAKNVSQLHPIFRPHESLTCIEATQEKDTNPAQLLEQSYLLYNKCEPLTDEDEKYIFDSQRRKASQIKISTEEPRRAELCDNGDISFLKRLHVSSSALMFQLKMDPSALFHIMFNIEPFQVLHLKMQDTKITNESSVFHDSTLHEVFRRGISLNLTELIDIIHQKVNIRVVSSVYKNW